MMPLHDLFSLVCSQDVSRSYTIAGLVLPFCQRCTGLYLGLATGMLALGISGSHRRGLPSGPVLATVIACLLIMPVFGFHLLDPGPSWRLWSGLIYGNAVAMLWMPATWTLASRSGRCGAWGRGPTLVFWAQFVLVNSVPWWFPMQSQAWAWIVLSLACVAGLGVVLCLGVCLVVLSQKILAHVWVKGGLHGSIQS